MTCQFFANCEFFKCRLVSWPAVAQMYQASYCNGNVAKCARYTVRISCGPAELPDTLFPNDEVGAQQILKSRSSKFANG